MHTAVGEPRCSNGIHCVAYPSFDEPSTLSRSNRGTRCFAGEEQDTASNSEAPAAERDSSGVGRPEIHTGARAMVWKSSTSVGGVPGSSSAREVWERRKRSVLTCERGLRSALASGDERLVRRWSRSLREAEERLVWAEADLARAEKWSEYTG